MNRLIAIAVSGLFAVCSLGLVCCHTSSNPPPEPPAVIVSADASSQIGTACTKISSICAVTAAVCTSGMTLAVADPVRPFIDWNCIGGASTKTAMQQCAGVGLQGCP